MPEQSKEPRYSLEEWQDKIAQTIHCVASSNYRDFKHLESMRQSMAIEVKYKALQAFHEQEMKAKEEEIEAFKEEYSQVKRDCCECVEQWNEGDNDYIGRPTCSKCGDLIMWYPYKTV